jgi:hypothetical protein
MDSYSRLCRSAKHVLVNNTGELPFERYNARHSTQLALFHQECGDLHAGVTGLPPF